MKTVAIRNGDVTCPLDPIVQRSYAVDVKVRVVSKKIVLREDMNRVLALVLLHASIAQSHGRYVVIRVPDEVVNRVDIGEGLIERSWAIRLHDIVDHQHGGAALYIGWPRYVCAGLYGRTVRSVALHAHGCGVVGERPERWQNDGCRGGCVRV